MFKKMRSVSASSDALARLLFATVLALLLLFKSATALAQSGSPASSGLPDTTIAPEGGDTTAPAPSGDTESAPPVKAAPPGPVHHRVHHTSPRQETASFKGAVEPENARLKLKQDSWAYSRPDSKATRLEQVHAGKFVNVTGSTRYYLQVKLKNGATAYVPASAIELTMPADKVFRLTKDTPVLSAPNHFGKRLAEVHNGHDVHVIGTAMNYMKIRMKDGLEGYISTTALE